MFKAFQRLLIILFVICSLLYGSSYLIHHAALAEQPVLSDPVFDVCDLPCFAMIVPAETTRDAIEPALLENIPTLTQLDEIADGYAFLYSTDDTGDSLVYGNVYHFNNVVHAIQLNNTEVAINRLFADEKQPTCVRYFQTGDLDGVVIYTESEKVTVLALVPGDPIMHLYTNDALVKGIQINTNQAGCSVTPDVFAWRGFIPLRFYSGESP